MSELNIITANLSHGKTYVTASRNMEDYGQVLKIEGMDLPSVYQVDFSNNLLRGTSMTVLGNADGVAIPDEYISTGRDVYAFLYLTGDMWGRTIATIRIPNKTRPKRSLSFAVRPPKMISLSRANRFQRCTWSPLSDVHV